MTHDRDLDTRRAVARLGDYDRRMHDVVLIVPAKEAHRWERRSTGHDRRSSWPARVTRYQLTKRMALIRMHHIERVQRRRDRIAEIDLGGEA